jgi:hypothetical protein
MNSTTLNAIPQPEPTLDDFLEAFFPDPMEAISLRAFKPKGAPGSPDHTTKKWQASRGSIMFDATLKEGLCEASKTRGMYFVVNSGGDKDADISRFNSFFVENDELTLAEQHAALDACSLQPSIRIETKRSVHAYWLVDGTCTEAEWREIQARLIAYFDGDSQNKIRHDV